MTLPITWEKRDLKPADVVVNEERVELYMMKA